MLGVGRPDSEARLYSGELIYICHYLKLPSKHSVCVILGNIFRSFPLNITLMTISDVLLISKSIHIFVCEPKHIEITFREMFARNLFHLYSAWLAAVSVAWQR